MTALQESLSSFRVSGNEFCGSCVLTSLPPSLRAFDISSNKFEGSVDTTQLPGSLDSFDLSSNHFEGELALEKLPETINMQRESMHFLADTPWERLRQVPGYNVHENHLKSYFKPRSAHKTKKGPEGVCRWNGVSCVDGIVARVHLAPPLYLGPMGAAVARLPQYVEHIALRKRDTLWLLGNEKTSAKSHVHLPL